MLSVQGIEVILSLHRVTLTDPIELFSYPRQLPETAETRSRRSTGLTKMKFGILPHIPWHSLTCLTMDSNEFASFAAFGVGILTSPTNSSFKKWLIMYVCRRGPPVASFGRSTSQLGKSSSSSPKGFPQACRNQLRM